MVEWKILEGLRLVVCHEVFWKSSHMIQHSYSSSSSGDFLLHALLFILVENLYSRRQSMKRLWKVQGMGERKVISYSMTCHTVVVDGHKRYPTYKVIQIQNRSHEQQKQEVVPIFIWSCSHFYFFLVKHLVFYFQWTKCPNKLQNDKSHRACLIAPFLILDWNSYDNNTTTLCRLVRSFKK